MSMVAFYVGSVTLSEGVHAYSADVLTAGLSPQGSNVFYRLLKKLRSLLASQLHLLNICAFSTDINTDRNTAQQLPCRTVLAKSFSVLTFLVLTHSKACFICDPVQYSRMLSGPIICV